MLTIRNSQLDSFSSIVRENFIDAMCDLLRTHFPDPAWLLTAGELRSCIHACLQRAARYQLHSQRDACRYLCVAARYGWEFESDPAFLWMRKILTDERISAPSDRLDLLVKQCIHRDQVLAANRERRQQLGIAPAAPASPLPASSALPTEVGEPTLAPGRRADGPSLADQQPPPANLLPGNADDWDGQALLMPGRRKGSDNVID